MVETRDFHPVDRGFCPVWDSRDPSAVCEHKVVTASPWWRSFWQGTDSFVVGCLLIELKATASHVTTCQMFEWKVRCEIKAGFVKRTFWDTNCWNSIKTIWNNPHMFIYMFTFCHAVSYNFNFIWYELSSDPWQVSSDTDCGSLHQWSPFSSRWVSSWRTGLGVKCSLMQNLQRDVNGREMLAGGTHTPRCILNAVNGALCPLKHAQHERKPTLS